MPFTAIFAGVSAVASIAGGIMGSNQAKKNNATARSNAAKQEAFNKEVSERTNKYNDKLDIADQANYHEMRDYGYETSIKNWKRGKELKNFSFAQELSLIHI